MTLQEIFNQLSSGEFSQLSIGGKEAGVIDEDNHAKVINHVNLGLTALYRRFNLKQGELILDHQDGLASYELNSGYALSARRALGPVRYILDSTDKPFQDDILKVERVVGALCGELPLNDAADPDSVFTPSARTLKVPAELKPQMLTVHYRANHPKISVGLGYFDPARVEVELPDSHLDALLLYVAGRAHTPVGVTNEYNTGTTYMARYEAACQELEGKGLQVDTLQSNTRLKRAGWV